MEASEASSDGADAGSVISDHGAEEREPSDLASVEFAAWASQHQEELRAWQREEERAARVPDELQDISTPAGAHRRALVCANDELTPEDQGVPEEHGEAVRVEAAPELDEALPGLGELRFRFESLAPEPVPAAAIEWADGAEARARAAGLMDDTGAVLDAERYHAWKERSLGSR